MRVQAIQVHGGVHEDGNGRPHQCPVSCISLQPDRDLRRTLEPVELLDVKLPFITVFRINRTGISPHQAAIKMCCAEHICTALIDRPPRTCRATASQQWEWLCSPFPEALSHP